MALITSIVDSVFPSNEAEGVILTDTIRVTFDREIDEQSIIDNIILEGADTDEVIHNAYTPDYIVQGEEASILESPGYTGIVPCTITFQRIALDSELEVSTQDVLGDGQLFRTKAIIKPVKPLRADTEYTIHIVGDQDLGDENKYGIRTRSVYDLIAEVSNTSTGAPTITGTYTGAYSNDTLNLRVVTGGILGVATFEWWLDSSPMNFHGPATTHVNSLNLIVGTDISFSEGTYVTGDEWTVYLKEDEVFEGQLLYTFTTGGGTILPVEDSTATSPTGSPLSLPASGSLTVVKTTPADLSVNQPLTAYERIIIEFDKVIDPTTLTDDMVTVTAERVSDHPSLCVQSPDGPIARILTVSGNKLIIDV